MKGKFRSLVIVLVAAMIVTMIPLTASAASNKPGRVTVRGMTAGKVSPKTNQATVVLKWKKVSKATGYQIFEKNRDSGKWTLLKTVKRSQTSLKIKGVSAGKYSVKVRALRKVKGKTYKGRFSKVKTKFIKSPLTLKQYAERIEPDYQNTDMDGFQVSVSGNKMILKYDLADNPELKGASLSDVNTDKFKSALRKELDERKSDFTDIRNMAKDYAGITGVKVVVTFVFEGTAILSRTY